MNERYRIGNNGSTHYLMDTETEEVIVTGTYFDCNAVLINILVRNEK